MPSPSTSFSITPPNGRAIARSSPRKPEPAAAHVGYADLKGAKQPPVGRAAALGLRFGDRVGTLAWNTQHHLEMYYALMGSGLVCHTLNPRLTVAHLAAMINEAEDRALAVAASLTPLLAELAPLCPRPRAHHLDGRRRCRTAICCRVIARNCGATEACSRRTAPRAAWGDFDEQTPAGLCYTSGTTGAPKGVLYTHRSNYLHTLRALQADAIALTGSDTVLIAVPMFHANALGTCHSPRRRWAPSWSCRAVTPTARASPRSCATRA